MEKRLRALFDYQRFLQNDRLARMISEAEEASAELSDEDLELVSAAGDPSTNLSLRKGEGHDREL